jgi:hypothetical protein
MTREPIPSKPADSGRVTRDVLAIGVRARNIESTRQQRAGEENNEDHALRIGIEAALAAQWQDWRIGMFERWREAAKEKGYTGICEAIEHAPPASPAGVPDGAVEVLRQSIGSNGHAVSMVFRSQESADRFHAYVDEVMKVLQNAAAPSAPEGDGGEE